MDCSVENPFDEQSEPKILLSEVKFEPAHENSHTPTNSFTEEPHYEYLEDSGISFGVSLIEVPNEAVQVKFEDSSESSAESNEIDEIEVPVPPKSKWKSAKTNYGDPDYKPSFNEKEKEKLNQSKEGIAHVDRMNLKNYTRTIRQDGCIFKDCTLKNTTVIPDLVRISLLKDYKLYVLKSSEVCSNHMQDQNWEDLLLCTFSKFTAPDIEDLLLLLKQASPASFNFEKIEFIPTRYLRYWMNVNKVQFQRIFDSFPNLQTLDLPKTSLSVYLMSLQKTEVDRIAMLLQFTKVNVLDMIKSVQDIVKFQTYEELNDVFKLEY